MSTTVASYFVPRPPISSAKTIARLKKSKLIPFAVSLTIFAERRGRLFISYLEVTAEELNAEGIKTVTATGYGDVAKEIVQYANSNKIDLIVMATTWMISGKATLTAKCDRSSTVKSDFGGFSGTKM